mmetsp:Transcript_30389/g.87065  ORF Transcript_30389/g.87065 Transcript_30389/m.87065 type:complete len:386 (-) Transcript_30389:78-1235(-)
MERRIGQYKLRRTEGSSCGRRGRGSGGRVGDRGGSCCGRGNRSGRDAGRGSSCGRRGGRRGRRRRQAGVLRVEEVEAAVEHVGHAAAISTKYRHQMSSSRVADGLVHRRLLRALRRLLVPAAPLDVVVVARGPAREHVPVGGQPGVGGLPAVLRGGSGLISGADNPVLDSCTSCSACIQTFTIGFAALFLIHDVVKHLAQGLLFAVSKDVPAGVRTLLGLVRCLPLADLVLLCGGAVDTAGVGIYLCASVAMIGSPILPTRVLGVIDGVVRLTLLQPAPGKLQALGNQATIPDVAIVASCPELAGPVIAPVAVPDWAALAGVYLPHARALLPGGAHGAPAAPGQGPGREQHGAGADGHKRDCPPHDRSRVVPVHDGAGSPHWEVP